MRRLPRGAGAGSCGGTPAAALSALKFLAQNRRGAREAFFAELKSKTRMDYILY